MTAIPAQPPRSQLETLFAPDSVAIVGASDDPTRISGRTLRYLRAGGFAGRVYPVNPGREVVQDLSAYRTVSDLPEVPDVAIIAIPAVGVRSALADCADAGVKGAIVFSAGFAETGDAGREQQEELVRIARDGGMRLLGPNCMGIFNARTRFFGTFANALDRELPTEGPVAVVSQSGAYGTHVYTLAQRRGLQTGYFASVGNQADVSLGEVLGWIAARDSVEVILVQVEGVGEAGPFVEALRVAHELRKPILLLKAGRSTLGRRASRSHTDALVGSDEVFEQVCSEYGVHRVMTTEEQIDLAYGCARGLYPRGRRLAVITISGGFGVQICDAAERVGLELPPLDERNCTSLRARFPFATFSNPIDATAQMLQEWDLVVEPASAVLQGDRYDALLFFLTATPLARSFSGALQETLTRTVKMATHQLIVACCVCDEATRRAYEDAGILVFEDTDRAVATIAALAGLREAFARPLPHRAASPDEHGLEVGPAPTEHDAKLVLVEAGVPVPEEVVVSTAGEAVIAADGLGYPVALKILSPDILHKTDIGGVALELQDAVSVRRAYAAVEQRVRSEAPEASIDGMLVSRMAPVGIDVIVGTHRDPAFGAVVMFGLGGIFVEIIADFTHRLAPVSEDEALRMIMSTRGHALLAGARGRRASDVRAAAAVVAAVSRLAAGSPRIQSIEINPLRVFDSGALALDAAIVPSLHRKRRDSRSPATTPGSPDWGPAKFRLHMRPKKKPGFPGFS